MHSHSVEQDNPEQEIILTAYFSGSNQYIEDPSSMAACLNWNNVSDNRQMHMGFSGCGVTNGRAGMLFGAGLKAQCHEVEKKVIALIKAGKKVKLNCYGHSRGGIAALLLAQMLGNFDEDVLEINLALLDTVPGNLIVTQRLDFLDQTLAKQAMDLSKCHNLKRVLSLYTNIPFPDLLAHAPLFSRYPKKTKVIVDVLPGRHSSVQHLSETGSGIHFSHACNVLTFSLISNFLKSCGTAFNFISKKFIFNGEVQLDDSNRLKEIYKKLKQELPTEKTRASHSYRPVKIKTDPKQPYLNKHHLALETGQSVDALNRESHCALSLDPPLSPRTSYPEIVHPDHALTAVFKEFLADLERGMSKNSKSSVKGAIIIRLQAEAKELGRFSDRMALKNALRNLLALSLQRDRYSYSFFSTTATGYMARTLLRTEKYRSLAELIQGTANHELRYRDLRMFVLGENNESYFNAKNREHVYEILNKSSLSANNISRYLSKVR